jgi:serine/threonine-protein kinase
VGQAVPVLEGVAANPGTAGVQVAFSSEETLVYVPGVAASFATQIDWATRDGKTSVLRAARANWTNLRFSPDGQKLALDISDRRQRDVWVYEWARDTLRQLTFDPNADRAPVWTPDGRRIVFASDRAKPGVYNLYSVNADGTGQVTRLTDSAFAQIPVSWHPSGRFLAFHQNAAGANTSDLMVLPMEGDAIRGWTPGTPRPFLATPAIEQFPMFSPDGRWIAYQSDESGSVEVYVRPFPGPGGQWRISTAGGRFPRWSATTHELLFVNQGQFFVASYAAAGDSFAADKPRLWTAIHPVSTPGTLANPLFDIHPDGKRLALAAAPDQFGPAQDHVVFISNFFDYLRKVLPEGSR